MDDVTFLTLDDVLEIHDDQLQRYGGASGIIDEGVVHAVTFAPQQTFGGEHLCSDIASMAAAYFDGFARSQAFKDGNKRTGAATALEFLARNGYDLDCTSDDLYNTTMAIAQKQITREQVADWIRSHLGPMA